MQSESKAAIVGCGPAGLMAAFVLSASGMPVEIFDAQGSAGCKFLIAGRGGLNITHSEPVESFACRYGDKAEIFKNLLADFSPDDLRAWLRRLGVETFVGSSGRVFPKEVKAIDILKILLATLRRAGVVFHYRHRWQGFSRTGIPLFITPTGELREFPARALLLALGGASWPQTGSDGNWVSLLAAKGVHLEPFSPANCGIEVIWSEHFRERFSGKPLKNVLLRCGDQQAFGDVMITRYGLEGGPVYTLGVAIRNQLKKNSPVPLFLDLKRDLSLERILERFGTSGYGTDSLANFLRKTVRITGPAYSLLREICTSEDLKNPLILAGNLKNLLIPVINTRPLAEAISSAGGITFSEVNTDLMLHKLPGVFVAGEMLDWEAPTGGYLLQGAFSTGYRAALGLLNWTGRAPVFVDLSQ